MIKIWIQVKKINKTNFKKILIVRTDRIGDVILTMPVAAALKKAMPEAHICFLCRQLTAVIGERNPDIDSVLTIDDKNGNMLPKKQLTETIRSGDFDCAVVTHPSFYLARLLRSSGIPLRIGTGYRFYSFLFNARHKEHRKESIKHEAEYNLGLLEPLDIPFEKPEFRFDLTENDIKKANETLNSLNIGKDDNFCVIHPGSGGSAMDWPRENFKELAQKLTEDQNRKVIITWGEGESGLADFISDGSNDILKLPEVLPLPVLAAVLKRAKLLVAPSTGVLHLANIMGAKVIGLYPPVRHESPVRWGPSGQIENTFVPDINDCPDCRGGKCRKIKCMDLITPDMVFDKAESILRHKNPGE
ncbi:glycosyltransferase family 9 protein [candidate division KSB1 bacterium]